MFKPTVSLTLIALAASVNAHLAAWHEAMYCLNGAKDGQDLNSYDIVSPLYQLPFRDWWFHHVNRCDEYPPAPGKFIDLPAGGSFMVEIASNRAKTTLSYGGRDTSDWPDGGTYPEDYNVPSCIISPNMHAQHHGKAAGTAFAISYTSDIKQVTPENLVVFSVKYMTPWKRVTYYDVPADMPPCPPDGCICAWGWVPNGCGQPNMYHQAFKCKVSGSRSNTPLATPKPPVWCEGDESKCVKGAKQMVYWNQLEGNNVVVDGRSRIGEMKSPGYNMVMGFRDGAQNDIFAGPASSPGPSSSSAPSASAAPTAQPSASPAPAPAPAPSPSSSAPSSPPSSSGSTTPTTGSSTGSDGTTASYPSTTPAFDGADGTTSSSVSSSSASPASPSPSSSSTAARSTPTSSASSGSPTPSTNGSTGAGSSSGSSGSTSPDPPSSSIITTDASTVSSLTSSTPEDTTKTFSEKANRKTCQRAGRRRRREAKMRRAEEVERRAQHGHVVAMKRRAGVF